KRGTKYHFAVDGDGVPVGCLATAANVNDTSPILEEPPSPSCALVVPKLAEALLEQIGGVEPLVGGEQSLQCFLAVEREVLPPREQSVFLAFDIASVAARKPRIFALADSIERLAEMTYDVELVE